MGNKSQSSTTLHSKEIENNSLQSIEIYEEILRSLSSVIKRQCSFDYQIICNIVVMH